MIPGPLEVEVKFALLPAVVKVKDALQGPVEGIKMVSQNVHVKTIVEVLPTMV
jgi:hypothetical protein